MADANNVDSVLIPREQAILSKNEIASDPVLISKEEIKEVINDEGRTESIEVAHEESQEIQKRDGSTTPDSGPNAGDDKRTTDRASEGPIDEYGNEIEKERTYTEQEVQGMIRDRLRRGQQSQGQTAKD